MNQRSMFFYPDDVIIETEAGKRFWRPGCQLTGVTREGSCTFQADLPVLYTEGEVAEMFEAFLRIWQKARERQRAQTLRERTGT